MTAGLDRRYIYLAAILCSVFFSVWRILGVDLINNDGAVYLQAALGDEQSKQHLHNWLFYPYLIGAVSNASGMGLEWSAHAVNLVLDGILVFAFLRVSELFGGGARVLFWAALIILSVPYLLENRGEIIRGHGYWAFSMVAFYYYVKLYRRFSWGSLAGWSVGMLLATLFRIEGLVIAALAPLGLLLNAGYGWPDRFRNLIRAWSPLLVAGAVLLFLMLFLDPFHNRLAQIPLALAQLGGAYTVDIPEKAALLRKFVFPLFSGDGAVYSIYSSLISAILIDLIESMSLVYFLVWVLRRQFPASGMAHDALPVIATFIVINFVVLFNHAALNFVMVSRYTMMAAILLLLVVAFALARVHQEYASRESRKSRILLPVLSLLIVAMIVAGLKSSPSSKLFILDAAQWVHSNVEEGETVATDYQQLRLRYYSNRGRDIAHWSQFATPLHGGGVSKDADYLLLRVKKGQPGRAALKAAGNPQLAKIDEILDGKGNGYLVFRRKS